MSPGNGSPRSRSPRCPTRCPRASRSSTCAKPSSGSHGRIDGAVHIPMTSSPHARASCRPASSCSSSAAWSAVARQVTAFLQRAGLEAVNLAGGLLEWVAAGRPMVGRRAGRPAGRLSAQPTAGRSAAGRRAPAPAGLEVLLPRRHLDHAQRREVRRLPLGVEQPKVGVLVAEQVDQRDQRDLRRVSHPGEHRLPGEQATDGDAVQAHPPARPRARPRPSAPSRAGAARCTPRAMPGVDPAARPRRVGAAQRRPRRRRCRPGSRSVAPTDASSGSPADRRAGARRGARVTTRPSPAAQGRIAAHGPSTAIGNSPPR